MVVSYDIIDNSTNQIVSSFGLKWLQEYTNFNMTTLDITDFFDYCQEEIEKIEMELVECSTTKSSEILNEMKNNLISKIYKCEDEEELKDILLDFLENFQMIQLSDTQQKNIEYLNWIIEYLKSFQTFLFPYLPTDEEQNVQHRGEISY
jgi:hypothetical protein